MTRARTSDRNAARFGQVVKRVRRQRGWSLVDLARATKMNAIHLGVVERGENVPTLTTIFRIADALEVPASTLIHEVAVARLEAHQKRIAKKAPVSKELAAAIEQDEFGRGSE